MKYVIDEDICSKYGLSLQETLGLVFISSCTNDFLSVLKDMEDNGITKSLDDGTVAIPQMWHDRMCKVLLESETTIPKQDRCEALAIQLRALFPKGMKYGSAAWRGNIREIALKLQKFFKLYGNKWTDEEILSAAKRYVESFNGNYTYMRILKYFILKNTRKINEDGVGFVEETSDLATCLENPEDIKNIDWTVDVR